MLLVLHRERILLGGAYRLGPRCSSVRDRRGGRGPGIGFIEGGERGVAVPRGRCQVICTCCAVEVVPTRDQHGDSWPHCDVRIPLLNCGLRPSYGCEGTACGSVARIAAVGAYVQHNTRQRLRPRGRGAMQGSGCGVVQAAPTLCQLEPMRHQRQCQCCAVGVPVPEHNSAGVVFRECAQLAVVVRLGDMAEQRGALMTESTTPTCTSIGIDILILHCSSAPLGC